MSGKYTIRSFVAALAAASAFTTFAADVVVNGSEDISTDVDGAIIVKNGGSARITAGINVAKYEVKGGGTLTVGAGMRMEMANSSNSNLAGCLDAPGSDVLDPSQYARIVLEENATIHDTSNSGVIMDAARRGGAAEITVNSGAFLDLFWKYLHASCNDNEETRNGNGRTVLNLYGRANIGEIHVADWFWNQGGDQDPLTWPEAMKINVYEGGWLGTRSISRNDNSLTRITFNGGGKLTFRWRGDFFSGGNGAEVLDFDSGTTELNTAFEGGDAAGVTIHRSTTYLTGSGSINKTGDGLLTIATECNTSGFTGDIYLSQGTLNFPIVADGVARKVYFQGGALAVPENGTFVTTRNGGSVEFISVNGADIKLVSNGNAKIAAEGSSVRCSGTGKPVFEGSFQPGELNFGSDSNGSYSSALPDGIAYGKVGSGTDTLIVNGLSNVNIHEGKLRTDQFRFWRMVFDDNAGTGNGVQISELVVYTQNENGDYVVINTESAESRTWTVTSHSTWDNQDESAEKALDWNLGSKFLSFDGFGGNADIIIEFPEPREIRVYEWYTANDCLDPNNGDCRTPTAWHWLASADGENWVEVGRVTGFNPATNNADPEACATNAWKSAGQWWLDYDKTHLVSPLGASTVTIDAGAVLLVDTNRTVSVGSLFNNGGTVELTSEGAFLGIGTASGAYLLGGGITGVGGVKKIGEGTAFAAGVNTYSGATVVSEGTYSIVSPQGIGSAKFFRFTFSNTEYGNSQFAWLKLCSADGTIQSTGLTATDKGSGDKHDIGVNAADLAPGTYSRVTGFQEWNASTESIAQIFDDKANTKFGGAKEGQIVFRLRDDAAPIVWYDVMSGGDDNPYGRRLTGFKLEASNDGTDWQTVSEVTVSDRDLVNNAWYSGTAKGYLVHLPSDATDATIPTASAVEVKPGATLDIETAMAISKLRINLDDEKAVLDDASATPGKIVRFSPAANGTLEIVAEDASILDAIAARAEIPIALDFESLSASADANLRTWSCTINGRRGSYRIVPIEGARNSRLKFAGRFAMMIR